MPEFVKLILNTKLTPSFLSKILSVDIAKDIKTVITEGITNLQVLEKLITDGETKILSNKTENDRANWNPVKYLVSSKNTTIDAIILMFKDLRILLKKINEHSSGSIKST